MDEKVAAPDLCAAEIAARQHGVITTRQLLGAGLTKRSIETRSQTGRLHRVHQGVYLMGYPGGPPERRWMAAVLACRGYKRDDPGDAFLSHRSAAALLGLLPVTRGPVDVAIIGEAGRARHRGVRVHRPRTLETEMTTHRLGIPVTDAARTIDDLRRAKPARGGATPSQLRRAIRQATLAGLPLGSSTSPDRTRSELEQLFLDLCTRHRLPAPEVNVEVDGLTVDFLWREPRLVVETDGYRYHRGRAIFEEDRRRDLHLRTAGFQVVRLSHDQVMNEPRLVATTLRPLIAAN
jgi:very-short-patch-repair endonuclease